jgi:hypothetical protein
MYEDLEFFAFDYNHSFGLDPLEKGTIIFPITPDNNLKYSYDLLCKLILARLPRIVCIEFATRSDKKS